MHGRITLTALALAAAVNVACLIKESTATIYIEPNGAATWVSLEKDVRSDRGRLADRDLG